MTLNLIGATAIVLMLLSTAPCFGYSDTRSVDVAILNVNGHGISGLVLCIANVQGQKPGLPAPCRGR
jgi:hypothetical protein